MPPELYDGYMNNPFESRSKPAHNTSDLILFDVDGTLIRSEGRSRHSRAFRAAFVDVYGTECRFSISMHGMTDLQIFLAVSEEMGLANGRGRELALDACHRMVEIYQLVDEGDGAYLPLPGVEAAVRTLAGKESLLGLLTGNPPEIARHKLESVGLAQFFSLGAYGTEAYARSGLPPIAIARASAKVGRAIAPDRVFIVGDTPRDVACARDNGCRAVAVATGSFGQEELVEAGAELVLRDLTDLRPLLRLIEG